VSNTQVSISQTVYVVAFAASDNSISRVELSDDNTPVRAESAPSALPAFSAVIPWTPGQLGAHILRVVAFDSNNVPSAPEEVLVSVTPDVRRPTANIIYPIGTPQIELGTILQIYAIATDEAGVTQLDLYVDNQLYTYTTSSNANGSISMPFVFAWEALTAGNHTLSVRSHDTQDQTTDSPPLKVFVADTHTPTVSFAVDRTNLVSGDSITVTISAVDVSGIQRVELWMGKELSNSVTSASPARQTMLSIQIPWQSGNPGDYALTVRAYNTNGNFKEAPAQTISVLRPGQATPTPPRTQTPTRTRTPRAQPTARLAPPLPPVAEISQPSDHFANQWPVRVSFSGKGNAELERVELWGYYQDQPNPQVICTVDARASTQKTGQCDWSPPNAGAVYLYAQAMDIYDQIGRSPIISGYIGVPALPTPTPTPISLAGRWTATTQAGSYSIVFRPIVTASGTALRGDFKITSVVTPTTETTGRITSGSTKGDRATFHVEFTPVITPTTTSTPDATPPTIAPTVTTSGPALDLDCSVDAAALTLDCKFKDLRGQSTAATFKREP
jgi:hypothetical protein